MSPTTLQRSVPGYRLHKASGQAVVTLDGHDHYLGKHGTPESAQAYEQLVATWLAHGRRLPEEKPQRPMVEGRFSGAAVRAEGIATIPRGTDRARALTQDHQRADRLG